MAHVQVNFDLCELHAQCVFAAPDVFRLNDDELEYEAEYDESLRADVQSAVSACPSQAISLVD